jgi:hypothetical protein
MLYSAVRAYSMAQHCFRVMDNIFLYGNPTLVVILDTSAIAAHMKKSFQEAQFLGKRNEIRENYKNNYANQYVDNGIAYYPRNIPYQMKNQA